MMGLTPRQQSCLDFLHSYHATNGTMPTLQEIIDHFGWGSKSNAARVLDLLEQRGHIRRSYKKARAIEFVTPETMQLVLLNREIYELVRSYAAGHRIGVDTAANELLRGALGAA